MTLGLSLAGRITGSGPYSAQPDHKDHCEIAENGMFCR
ncbi:hypothetical protein ASAP_1319 [Asaia bogorensis]|uniref:Uncharacterized protein n=1 Tax=Asaia bogorensis TaxID=91915 RepID=A0A060QE15_9PROT|nr:hypothetical protein ASAP_1319 [Asaia bogorensis]